MAEGGGERPQNLRAQTMQGGAVDPLRDFKRMSFSMNARNVAGTNAVKPELLCALCQAILFDPWECKVCHSRFHQICLNKFAKETGQCPMLCAKPRFINVKKEVERQLIDTRFVCNNSALGCTVVLSYEEVRDHDSKCRFTPIKCSAFSECKTKCLRKDLEKHQSVCPNVLVPCIYCRSQVARMNILHHEQEECSGTYTCGKCGMTIVREETKKNSHNCFNALAGYLQNMLASKDYVIQVFREELERKNTFINQLLERQEQLEGKLTRIESVLAFDKDVALLPDPPEVKPAPTLTASDPFDAVVQSIAAAERAQEEERELTPRKEGEEQKIQEEHVDADMTEETRLIGLTEEKTETSASAVGLKFQPVSD